jgi:RNA polymerase sigma factor (sigma-70 family)
MSAAAYEILKEYRGVACEDVAQSTFEKLWNKVKDDDTYIKDDAHLHSWLYRVCKNQALKTLAKLKKTELMGSSMDIDIEKGKVLRTRGEVSNFDMYNANSRKFCNLNMFWVANVSEEETDKYAEMYTTEKTKWFLKNLPKLKKLLSKKELLVFNMRLKGLGYKEIAEKLKITRGAVYFRFFKACKRLKDAVSLSDAKLNYAA